MRIVFECPPKTIPSHAHESCSTVAIYYIVCSNRDMFAPVALLRPRSARIEAGTMNISRIWCTPRLGRTWVLTTELQWSHVYNRSSGAHDRSKSLIMSLMLWAAEWAGNHRMLVEPCASVTLLDHVKSAYCDNNYTVLLLCRRVLCACHLVGWLYHVDLFA